MAFQRSSPYGRTKDEHVSDATLTECASTRRWKLTRESRLMATPAVDVLLPEYNAAGTIDQAVESLLRQTISDIRIIIVDDGSTDATPRALTRLARQDPRITVVTTANGGIVDALKCGTSPMQGGIHCSTGCR
jgi:cellulose synthase/poly-beta-1,6-N-acetylglucosamine synthase-like glycosyltransferase